MAQEIIDLKPEKPDEGELRYTYARRTSVTRTAPESFLARAAGALIAAGVFFLILFFFVYVILPVIAIFLIWMFVRGLFGRR